LKIRKPERFLANARMRHNLIKRYARVKKHGMGKRASNKKEFIITKRVEEKNEVHKKKKKTKHPKEEEAEEEEGDDKDDDEKNHASSEEMEIVKYQSNSVGSKLVFAIRIRDGIGSPYKVQKALRSLRLNNVNEGIFLHYTPSTQKILHLVSPFILYGIPSEATVRDLIVRRGHGRIKKIGSGGGGIGGNRTSLSNNLIIENSLGDETGIICIEDLVHEIYNVGEHFKKAVSFLATFQFTEMKSRFQKAKLNMKTTKEYGDKGELIDNFIRKML